MAPPCLAGRPLERAGPAPRARSTRQSARPCAASQNSCSTVRRIGELERRDLAAFVRRLEQQRVGIARAAMTQAPDLVLQHVPRELEVGQEIRHRHGAALFHAELSGDRRGDRIDAAEDDRGHAGMRRLREQPIDRRPHHFLREAAAPMLRREAVEDLRILADIRRREAAPADRRARLRRIAGARPHRPHAITALAPARIVPADAMRRAGAAALRRRAVGGDVLRHLRLGQDCRQRADVGVAEGIQSQAFSRDDGCGRHRQSPRNMRATSARPAAMQSMRGPVAYFTANECYPANSCRNCSDGFLLPVRFIWSGLR